MQVRNSPPPHHHLSPPGKWHGERAHRQLKDALKSRLAGPDWLAHLPWVLLSLRATPKEDSNISAAELVYGAPLLLPGQLQCGPEPPPAVFAEAARDLPLMLPTRPLSSPLSPSSVPAGIPLALQKAGFVYVRRRGASPPLTPAYSGPFRVISRSEKHFTLDLGSRSDVVSVDRPKPHRGLAPVIPAVAPKRGRPSTSVPSPG